MAILGPDGSGKSTIAQGIERSSAVPARVFYLGLSDERLPRAARMRIPVLREAALLLTLWSRYAAARLFQVRGGLVLFDRHTYDALLPAPQSLGRSRRLSRWLRAHSCPPPDLLLILDVPGQIMYQRKGEHTPQHLEAERREFLSLARRLSTAQLVDAARPQAAVLADVQGRIEQRRRSREDTVPRSVEMESAVMRAGLSRLPALGNAQRRWLGRRQLREARLLAPNIVRCLPERAGARSWQVQRADWTRTDVAVLALGPAAREPQAFLKIPWTPSGADSLRAHAAVLAALRREERLAGWHDLLPCMLSSGAAGSRAYWLEEALPGIESRRYVYNRSERCSLHRAAAEAITELHRRTATSRLVDTHTLQSWVHQPIERMVSAPGVRSLPQPVAARLEEVGWELQDALVNREVIVSWVHRDFWACNLLYDGSTGHVTGILDWDRAIPAGLPLLDLIHLLIQSRKLVMRQSEQGKMIRHVLLEGWTRSELDILRLGLLPFPLDDTGNRIIMLLYWLDRMSILLRQDPARADSGRWVARNIQPVLSCL